MASADFNFIGRHSTDAMWDIAVIAFLASTLALKAVFLGYGYHTHSCGGLLECDREILLEEGVELIEDTDDA